MSEPDKQISYLAAALKAPRVREVAIRLAHQARDSGWTHEDYLIGPRPRSRRPQRLRRPTKDEPLRV